MITAELCSAKSEGKPEIGGFGVYIKSTGGAKPISSHLKRLFYWRVILIARDIVILGSFCDINKNSDIHMFV